MNCLALAAIGLHLVSWHSHEGYSGVNPGVYVKSECGFTLGAFRNSERRLSVYGAYTYDPPKLPVWASAGIATGYGPQYGRPRGWTPVFIVGLKTPQYEGYRLRVGYIPKLGEFNNTHVLHLMIEKEF